MNASFILNGKRALVLAAAVGLFSAGVARSQNFSPGVADIGKLAAGHVPEDTIINYVKTSGIAYHLTPDDIIYLTGQGVTPNVMALLQSSAPPADATAAAPAPAAAPEPPPTPAAPPADASVAPAPTINMDYFQGQLGPYGTWIDLPPYGAVWKPGIAMNDPLWRPYCQGGHWVMTDAGWYWQADDPWGSIVFHYGRWMFDDANGWVWVPGYNWAPSWVAWRRTDGFYGWAPLPPQAEFVAGVGLAVGGVAVVADFDFGLRGTAFTFVGFDHMWDHDYGVVMLPAARVDIVFGGSVAMNSYRVDRGRFVCEGFGREDLVARTGRPVEVVEVNKQVTVERTVVVNNITSVKNVSIRNNVTTVRNVTSVNNVHNVTSVNNVRNATTINNVNNTRNLSAERTVNNAAAQRPAVAAGHPAVSQNAGAIAVQHPAVAPQHPATAGGEYPGAPHTAGQAGAYGAQHPLTNAAAKKPVAKGTNAPPPRVP